MEVVNKEALIVKHTIVKMEQMDYLLKVFLWNVLEYLTLLI